MPQSRFLNSIKSYSWQLVVGLITVGACSCIALHAQDRQDLRASAIDRLKLQTIADPDLGRVSRGTYTVFENRAEQRGRVIDLAIVILHARSATPERDPIFFLAGGPGQDATTQTNWLADNWMRSDRDIVLVSQRGTGGSMRFDCDVPEINVQRLLDPMFDERAFRDCLGHLQARAGLTQYSTPIAMDDLNEVRAALGYSQINLVGGSYGTRAALVYMRQHPESVRSAILLSPAPMSFTNPLFHASEAQAAVNRLFDACAADPECAAAFPNLASEFAALIERLEHTPVEVEISHPASGKPTQVQMSRAAFAEALRVMMYHTETAKRVPLLVHRAFEGDCAPFAQAGIQSNGRLRDNIAFGMLLCVTCTEDVARITEEAIVHETANTALDDDRVRQQKAVCDFWPRSKLPEDYAEPVSVNVPTLVISGTFDPVTSPRWGAETVRHLPESKHITVPGAHDVSGECVDAIMREFLNEASVEVLETTCVERMRLPRFETPLQSPAALRQFVPGTSMGIASAPNLRDIGGYTTKDGALIRKGVAYRSSQLSRIAPDDKKQLAGLGLKNVFDLRTKSERDRQPDDVPAGVKQVWLNVLADSDGVAVARIQKLLSDPAAANKELGEGKASEMLKQVYREFITLPSAHAAYHDLFVALSDENELPSLFHCSSGKDRTGWAAAALLTLLGVPEDQVYEDFLRSNDYVIPAYQGFVDRFVADGGERSIVVDILGVKKEYLQAAFEEVNSRYGSIEAYFDKGLGIDSASQKKMRDRFLDRSDRR